MSCLARKRVQSPRIKLTSNSLLSFNLVGTSVAPLSQLLLQPALHHLPPTLAKYNPAEDLEQHGFEITPVPFDTSPFVLPSLLPSGPPLNLGELGKIEDPSTIRWNKLDAVPIYMPFYAAKFTIGTEGPDYSLLFDASSPEVSPSSLSRSLLVA